MRMKLTNWGLLALSWAGLSGAAQAFPGQTPDQAAVWIQAHPTLQPAKGERLLVRRSHTPAQRFSFQASPLPVGRMTLRPQGSIIRTEEILLVDLINGVTPDRLEESLRVIYGSTVYEDYIQANRVITYPTSDLTKQSAGGLGAGVQGEVREGDRYAYWWEITRGDDRLAHTGKLTVFLREDLPKLEAELRNRP